MNFRNLILPLLCVALFSCEGDTIDKNLGARSANVNAIISGANTRMDGDMWENNDAIGLYMKRTETSLPVGVIAQNIKYIFKGNATFSAENINEEILFPFNGSDVDFISYYPYQSEITNYILPIDVTDQSNQNALDLLYSDNATGLSSKNPNVNLIFTHQLSKIVLNITTENTTADLSDLSVKITNAGKKASFSLADGNTSPPTEIGDVFFKTSSNGKFAEAILLPMSNLIGRNLVFTIGTETYVFALSSSLNITSFEKSTKYTYNIIIDPTGVQAVVSSSSIESWIEEPAEDGAALPDTDPGSSTATGAFDNPFTVTESPIFVGRKDVWVIGFVVGYYSGTTHTSFVNNATNVSSASNIALAASPTETDSKKTMPVQLPAGAIRDIVNLQQNPQNLGKQIMLRGDINSYFGLVGLRNTKGAFIDGVEYPQ